MDSIKHNLKEYDTEYLRQNIGLVLQKNQKAQLFKQVEIV